MPKFFAVLSFLSLTSWSQALAKEHESRPIQADKLQPQIIIQVVITERDLKSGFIEILSRPQLMAREGESAVLNLGYDPSYTMTNHSVNIHYPRLAVRLQVTPKMTSPTNVELRAVAEVNAVFPEVVSVGNGHADHLECALTSQDGQGVVTKGIKVTERMMVERRIPWLADFPAVGWLFRKCTPSISQSEVIVLLIPRIIQNREEQDWISRQLSDTVDYLIRQPGQNRLDGY